MIILFFILVLGLCVSLVFGGYLPAILVLAILYFWLLMKHPEIALVLALLICVNVFSVIPDDLFRLPYIFRLRDIFFISLFIPLLAGILLKDKRIGFVFSNPIALVVLFMLILTIVQILLTQMRFPSEGFGSIVRMSRRYWYYALFYPALYILLDERRCRRFLILSVTIVCLFCVIYIVQFILGPHHKIFLHADITSQWLQGFKVTRIYVDGTSGATLLFQTSLMALFINAAGKVKMRDLWIVMLTGAQNVLMFSRANIMGIVGGIFICFLGMHKKMRIGRFIIITLSVILFFIAADFGLGMIYPEKQNLAAVITKRVASMAGAISNQDDTISFRIRDNAGRFKLFTDNALMGIGFIHDDSNLFLNERGFSNQIRTSDTGLLTLLIDFGWLGMLWFLFMAFVFFKNCLIVMKQLTEPGDQVLMLGVASYYFGRFISFVTLADFVFIDGIVVVVVCLALSQAMHYKTLRTASV